MRPLALAIDGTLRRALAYAEEGRVFAFDPNQPRDEDGRWTLAGAERAKQAVKGTVVADDNGEPILMFHGSSQEFTEFDPLKIKGDDTDAPFNGIWFTSDESEASPAFHNPKLTYEAYVDIRNPAPVKEWYEASRIVQKGDLPFGARSYGDATRMELQRRGYDGVIFNDVPKVDRVAFERSGEVTTKTARGAILTLKKEDGGVSLYRSGEFITGYESVDQFLSQNSKVVVAFDPKQVHITDRRPSRWGRTDAKKTFSQKDYAALKPRLDALEAASLEALRDALSESRDALVARVRKAFNFAALVNDLKRLPRFGAVEMEVRAMLDRAREAGRKDLRREVREGRRDFADSSFTPKAATRWLRATAFWVAGILGDRVLADVKGIILNGLKTGTASSVMAEQIFDAFTPWLGDPDVIRDEQQLQPWRLETIVRTNTTTAYNHGRLSEIIDPEIARFVKGIRYSAILDERTTEVCRYLGKMNDGKGALFKPSDPNIESLLPPLHYSCRSIIVAVVAGEKVDASEFITPEQIGKARGLADAKFLTQASAAWKAYSEREDDEVVEKPKRKQKKATEFTVAKQADGALKITRTEVPDGEV